MLTRTGGSSAPVVRGKPLLLAFPYPHFQRAILLFSQ